MLIAAMLWTGCPPREPIRTAPSSPPVPLTADFLDPQRDARPWLTGRPLAGPFADLAAFCASLPERVEGAVPHCDPEELRDHIGPRALAEPWGGYEEVRVFSVFLPLWGEGLLVGTSTYHLAVRTARGWFVTPRLGSAYNPGAFGIYSSSITESLALADVVQGGAPELLFRFTTTMNDRNGGAESYQQTGFLVLCGLGESDRPSCTGPIPQAGEAGVTYDEGGRDGAIWEFTLTLLEGGRAGRIDGDIDGDTSFVPFLTEGLVGTHPLSLP